LNVGALKRIASTNAAARASRPARESLFKVMVSLLSRIDRGAGC
jgi:hypothetical protein